MPAKYFTGDAWYTDRQSGDPTDVPGAPREDNLDRWCCLILKQFYLPCLAHASYLIGDEETGTAAVVDPQRDIDEYLAFASRHHLHICHVFLTHLHADFVADIWNCAIALAQPSISERRPKPPTLSTLFA